MAQGSSIKKSSKFVLPSKTKPKSQTVSKKPKRGPHFIAPKKTKIVQARKIRNSLHKAIGQKIEQELVTLASKEGENLRVLSSSKPKPTSNTGKVNSKGK